MNTAVDFVVIGGGIAGASAASELAAHGRVALLEREATCGQHATGRSAALFTECYGEDVVRLLAIASRSFLETPPSGFATQPLLRPRSLLFVARPDQLATLEAATGDYRRYVPSVSRVDTREAVDRCRALRPDYVAGGLFEPGAMDLDVHELHQSYLRAVVARGGTVHTRAGVRRLMATAGGWEVDAGETRLATAVVVNAAGAWCDEVARMAGVAPLGLVPKRRTAFTFAPPGPGHEAWPMVVDIDERFYFKPEGPQLLASPGDETPMEPVDVRHEEIDVAAGIERIEAATTMNIRHVKSAWAGLRSFVADNRPVVGMDPDHAGFFWLAGQGGFGIKTAPALAQATAALVVDGGLPPQLTETGITAAELSPVRLRG